MVKPLILFDLDGTLIDSTEAIVEGFFHAFDTHKMARPSIEAITAHIGHTLEDIFLALGASSEIVESLVLTYKEKYRVISKPKTVLLPYAQEAITLAGEFGRLGVVTTKTGRYSKELLEYFGILDAFEVVIGREDVINPKPHAEPIHKALEAMGVDHRNDETIGKIWMIGDTILDLQSAQNAHILGIGLLSGYGTREQLGSYDTPLYENVLEAVKHIQNKTL